jgi:hypothetical protein
MTLLELIDYLGKAHNMQFHLHRIGDTWEVVWGSDEYSTMRGKGKTLAEALSKIVSPR